MDPSYFNITHLTQHDRHLIDIHGDEVRE